MKEIIFLVEEAPEGGYVAQALGASIVTQAEDWDELQKQVRDAVLCHFDADQRPATICLRQVREQVLAV
jgi:sulfur relay (sulfurtransferase) DsrF/TusC family protein